MGLFQDIKAAFTLIRKDRGYKASKEEFDSIIAYGYAVAIDASVANIRRNLNEQDWYNASIFFYYRYEIFMIKRMINLMHIIIIDRYHIEHDYCPMLKAIESELTDLDERLYSNNEITKEKKTLLLKELDRIDDRSESIRLLCRMVALV